MKVGIIASYLILKKGELKFAAHKYDTGPICEVWKKPRMLSANKPLHVTFIQFSCITHKFNAMQTKDLILEIQRLPIAKRFYVVEETLKSIKNEEMQHQMELAVNELYEDYVNDKELTSFTSLDFENFYETK